MLTHLPSPCHIVSDTHLGVTPLEVERSFDQYLRSLPSSAKSLVINGDLFDFWFEWKHVIPRAGFRTLAALADIADAGVKILWIAGNHDCWGGEILRKDVGVTYQLGDWEGTIGSWQVRFEHGDGLRDVEDRRYRMVRPIMRSPLAIKLFRLLHPDWATRIATGSSQASRTHGARDGGKGLRAIGHSRLVQNPHLDLVVFGHSHVAALERVPNAGIFANAGSWLDAPTFLVIDGDRVELRSWRGTLAERMLTESDRLDALDRRAEESLADAKELVGQV